jgi:lysine 6-dehydrogenase
MQSVIVLGAGRVGAAMARDLARDRVLRVTVVDSSPSALRRLEATPEGGAVAMIQADLSDPSSIARLVEGQDLAIGAVPGPMGFRTLTTLIQQGVNTVDISFFEEDAHVLDDLARQRGVVAVVDAGVAPGLSNLILGHHEARLRETTRFECLVGGIPSDPSPPWDYKAPFSPIDVLAEYTRPARFRRDGREVTLPALSEVEELELAGVGRVEAFLTDGLRTLLRTSQVPTLLEKTVRWPGHAGRVRVLRDGGFLDPTPLDVGGRAIAPLEVSSALLFRAWRYEPGEMDLTVMRVEVDGVDLDGPVRHTYHLLDHHDPAADISSMARTTGYTATALARLVLDGRFRTAGVAPPEVVARVDGALEHVLGHLRERGVGIRYAASRKGDGGRPATP